MKGTIELEIDGVLLDIDYEFEYDPDDPATGYVGGYWVDFTTVFVGGVDISPLIVGCEDIVKKIEDELLSACLCDEI